MLVHFLLGFVTLLSDLNNQLLLFLLLLYHVVDFILLLHQLVVDLVLELVQPLLPEFCLTLQLLYLFFKATQGALVHLLLVVTFNLVF